MTQGKYPGISGFFIWTFSEWESMAQQAYVPQFRVYHLSYLLSNEKNLRCLGYIGDYTTQLYRDYNEPLQGSLLTNQYNGK